MVIAEAMAGFSPAGGHVLLDNRVERFNFQNLVGAFDSALAANPTLTSRALTNGLAPLGVSRGNVGPATSISGITKVALAIYAALLRSLGPVRETRNRRATPHESGECCS